jgi:glycosyltransferase involved in cell wall biosynthesis
LNQKRIAILMPDLRGGGAERVAVNVANALYQRGFLVDMVLLSATGVFLSDLHPEIRLVDLRIRNMRWALVPIALYLRQHKPVAILANMWPLTVLAIWARGLALVTTRVVVVEHTTWSKDPIVISSIGKWKVRTTMHLTFPNADGIVAVSNGAAKDLAHFANLDQNTISVIYNPIVENHMQTVSVPLVPQDWLLGSHQKVIAIGNLIPIKDYKTLLLAFANLRKKLDVKLLILGEGYCRFELELCARKLRLDDCLFMPGFVKNPWPYLLRADLLVLSSMAEGFSNVIVEALSVGTPVVSTDCQSGPREILSDGQFGQLVPIGNVQELALAMANSLSSVHDRSALIERAQEFSICKAVNLYEALLIPADGMS